MQARRRGTAIESAEDRDLGATGSNRVFGWVMAAAAALLSLWCWRRGHTAALPFAAATSVILALLAVLAPTLLQPLNRAWMAFGHVLGRIFSPIVMGLIFFGVVTPIAVIARWRGLDPMRRRFDPVAKSYWIERQPPGPDPATMERQF
jgi:hypothetical protein